jgi:hypothetical protein
MQATTAIPVSAAPSRNTSADHRFYLGSAIGLLAVAIVAFVPGMIDASSRRGPITVLAAVHGVAFFGWLVLYLVQTVLASTGNLRLHRRLGVVGMVLAVGMIVIGYRTTIEMVRRGFDLSGDLARMGPVILQTSFQLVGLPLFGGLVLAAILNRRRPAIHKRLMWLATSSLIGAPVAHAVGHYGLPSVVLPLTSLSTLAANPLFDRIAHGRVHPVSLWGGVCFMALGPILAVVVSPNPAWQRFVLWLAS